MIKTTELEQCGNGGTKKAQAKAAATRALKKAGIDRETADEADMQWLESKMKAAGIPQELIEVELAKKEEFLRNPKNSMLVTASDHARLDREESSKKQETTRVQRIEAERDSKRFLSETPPPSDRQFQVALKEVGPIFDKFLARNKSDLSKNFEPLAASYVQIGRQSGFSDQNIAIYIKRVNMNFEIESANALQRVQSRAM